MIVAGNCKSYIQRLFARIVSSSIARPEDLGQQIPSIQLKQCRDETWLIGRGEEYYRLTKDKRGEEPLTLVEKGRMHLFIRIKRATRTRPDETEIVAYNLKFMDLSRNSNEIRSLRFDRSSGCPKWGWDDILLENIEHPWQHLHINFDSSESANELRLATGFVCPIIAIANFAHWYRFQTTKEPG